MENKVKKLENPARLRELDPANTLLRIGLKSNHIICDIGAGSGIFTFPAARLTQNSVFAVDIDDRMLAHIAEKAKAEHLGNVVPVKTDCTNYPIDTASVDLALAVTVLHEIPDKDAFILEVRRMLKGTGKAAVIEFHKRETPMGAPMAMRISKAEARAAFESGGFMLSDEFDLGENLYCQVYTPDWGKQG